jgi:hypothetical protein
MPTSVTQNHETTTDTVAPKPSWAVSILDGLSKLGHRAQRLDEAQPNENVPEPVLSSDELIQRISEGVQGLIAPKRAENDSETIPLADRSFKDPLQGLAERLEAQFPGREQREAALEATRREIHPEFVSYDAEWVTLIEEYKDAHPNHDPRLWAYHLADLKAAAASARLSGDSRDLGRWFSALKLWSSSRTRSEGFKSEIIKGSDNPSQETEEQREQRHQKWLHSVRRAKERQKQATCTRKKARQRDREDEALRTGGSVSISKAGRKTVLSREARDARARNIERYNQTRLADNRPATFHLPHVKHRLRSKCEEKVMQFGLNQLFPDLDMIYSETRPDRVSEIGCTWRGNLARWERDIDVVLKGEGEFQIQTKGLGYWYILLRSAIKDTGCVITPKQPKSLENLFHTLSTIGIRSMLNGIQETCKTDNVRPLLFCSAKSVHTWVKSKHTFSHTPDLIDLFAREDVRFRRYFWKFFQILFPREVAILRRAETRLRSELADMGNPKIDAKTVAEGFSICLSREKSKDGYTDDRALLAERLRQLRTSKGRKQVLHDLPSWFRATPTVPAKHKRDRKGRFLG